jgi:hypothetical protein
MGVLDEQVSRGWRIATFGLAGIIAGTLIGKAITSPANYIPKAEQVQQGYVVPSKLGIELQDLDGNGKDEVLMKYDGKSYLLKLDEQGRPEVQAYEVRPAEVVPKSE